MNTKIRALLTPLMVSIPFSVAVATNVSDSTTSSSTAFESDNEVKYDGPLTIKLGTRLDYQREYQKSDLIDANSGFKGKNLMISIQGNITEKFSYRFRQRISQTKKHNDFFDGTDYMWLQYNFNNRWDVRAGKIAIEHGSTEYQRDPSEQYVFSDFWNYPACYLFGLNLGYNVTTNDRFVLQAAESSFRTKDNDVYAYALSWYGNHDWFHTMYTMNMTEYRDGKFVYYIGLGNQFDLGKVLINVDYMNRFTDSNNFWKDCTLRGELMYRPSNHFNIVGFGVYSSNKAHDLGATYIPYGTEMTRIGGILEYSPIPKIDKTLKFHAGYSYGFGNIGVKHETPSLYRHFMTVGMQWEMDIIELAKKIWKNN